MTTATNPLPDVTDSSDGKRPARRPYDAARVEAAVREILVGIGEDPDRDGLRDTPARVARAYAEMFAGLRQDPESVLTSRSISARRVVLVKDIELNSTCEHHLVPFHGWRTWATSQGKEGA